MPTVDENTKQLVESFDGLSTVQALRWIVFLYECLHGNDGKDRLLLMIESLLRRVQADTASGMSKGHG